MRATLGGLCLLVALSVAACGGGVGDALSFILAFDDSVPLSKGDAVVYKGIRIGEVRDVDLDEGGAVAVQLRVDAKYAGLPYREADYLVDTVKDGKKKRHVVRIEDRDVAVRTPVEPGDILEPVEGWADRSLRSLEGAREKTAEAWDSLVEGARGMMERAKDYADSEQAAELRESMDRFLEDSREHSEELLRKFNEEEYPELKRRAEAYREWLLEQGLVEEAKKFWDEFVEWSREMFSGSPETFERQSLGEDFGET